jgi:hypothetical protein
MHRVSVKKHNYICNIQMRNNYVFRPFLVRLSSGWNTKLSGEIYYKNFYSSDNTTEARCPQDTPARDEK